MADQKIVIINRHRPHELLLLAVSVFTGAAYTLGSPPPASISALLPGWALHVWSVGLATSGFVGLLGALTRRPWSMHIEQAGLLLGAGALVWYAAAVAPFGWRASFVVAVSLGWAVANLWRSRQIHNDINKGPR